MLAGLTALGFVGVAKGSTATRRATAFWATEKLVGLAAHYGVRLQNIRTHFKPEPPHNPLVLRGHGVRMGNRKIRGPIIKKYKHTDQTKQLEADLKALNAFLADCEISGGEHEGYTRNFNNGSWKKGGRLYSIGGGYQQMSPPEKRLEMTINGEAVAEIDIKASHLTIIHAKLGAPLSRDSDPYEGIKHVGVDRTYRRIYMHRIALEGSAKALNSQSQLNTDYDFFKMLRDRGRRAAHRFLDAHFDDIGMRGTVDLAQEVQAEWA
jgi:hypothetical protein